LSLLNYITKNPSDEKNHGFWMKLGIFIKLIASENKVEITSSVRNWNYKK
jgi:hypothetical protein